MEFLKIDPIWMTLFASLFTWGVTAAGAGCVFFFKKVNQKVMDIMMGFSAGVMIAASFFSLLLPAIELSETLQYPPWLFPFIGFLAGSAFVLVTGQFLDKVFSKKNEGASLRRSILLVSSITLHNIPEGLSVGVAFGALALGIEGCDVTAAMMLALGIGIQNFPEGAAVSLPLLREGVGRWKSFLYGQASGFVEPCFAMVGFFLATLIRAALPFALSFSAGAMIAVVALELIPESAKENRKLSCIGLVAGFVIMMTLDVALS